MTTTLGEPGKSIQTPMDGSYSHLMNTVTRMVSRHTQNPRQALVAVIQLLPILKDAQVKVEVKMR